MFIVIVNQIVQSVMSRYSVKREPGGLKISKMYVTHLGLMKIGIIIILQLLTQWLMKNYCFS